MTEQRYAGFENLNSYRNYPFSETANLYDLNGVVLAEDIFVDAFLYPIVDEMSSVSLTLVDFSVVRLFFHKESVIEYLQDFFRRVVEPSQKGATLERCVEFFSLKHKDSFFLICGKFRVNEKTYLLKRTSRF